MKYVPSILVKSSDLTVKDDEGVEHRPHEGEWVRFRKSVPMSVMRLATAANRIGDLDDDASEEELSHAAEEYGQVSEELIDALARQILNWNWTDEHWEPLPTPSDGEAFRDVLWNLEDYEVAWLMEHMSDGARVEKNSS
jgi:hypothetical protein